MHRKNNCILCLLWGLAVGFCSSPGKKTLRQSLVHCYCISGKLHGDTTTTEASTTQDSDDSSDDAALVKGILTEDSSTESGSSSGDDSETEEEQAWREEGE